jgi:hypothetical protein
MANAAIEKCGDGAYIQQRRFRPGVDRDRHSKYSRAVSVDGRHIACLTLVVLHALKN